MIGHYDLPVRSYKREISWEKLIFNVIYKMVRLTQDNTFAVDTEPEVWYPQIDMEQLNPKLDQNFSSFLEEGYRLQTFELSHQAEEEMPASITIPDEPCLPWSKDVSITEPVHAPSEIEKLAAAGPVFLDGHTYYLFEEINGKIYSRKNAVTFCKKAGGHLATITSAREQYAVNELFHNLSLRYFWAGATDIMYKGAWKWETGEDFQWNNWTSGSPDNRYNNENCLALNARDGGRWVDLSSEEQDVGFLLEMEPEPAAEGISPYKENVYLTDLQASCLQNARISEYMMDPYGNRYFQSLNLIARNNGKVEYDLDRKYASLSFILGTSDEANRETCIDMMIWGDEKLLFTVYGYGRADAPIPVLLDVKDVSRISIQTASHAGNGNFFLNQAILTPARQQEISSSTAVQEKHYLIDIPAVSTRHADIITGYGMMTDSAGRLYRDAVKISTKNTGEVVFRLPAGSEKFRGKLAMATNPGSDNSSAVVEILGDEKILMEEEITPYSDVLPVDLNVEGIRILSIRAKNNPAEGEIKTVLLGNICLEVMSEKTRVTAAGLTMPEFPQLDPVMERNAAAVLICGNYKYYRYDQAVTYQKAKKDCEKAGAALAMPKTEKQNRAIQSLIQNGLWDNYRAYWIGGYQSGNTFLWQDQTPISKTGYTNWSGKKPRHQGEDGIVLSMERNGIWRDSDTSNPAGFVLEVKAAASLQPEIGEQLSRLPADVRENFEVFDYITQDRRFLADTIQLRADKFGYAQWSLEGKYLALTAALLPGKDFDSNALANFAIFGDGILLYQQEGIRKGTEPRSILLDLSGINTLTIKSSANLNSFLYITEPTLYPAGNAASNGVDRLSFLKVIDQVNTETRNTLTEDIYGRFHDSAVGINASGNGYFLYNLDGKYTSMDCKVVSTSQTRQDQTRTVRILLDGKTAYEKVLEGYFPDTEPIHLDLKGVSTIKIEAEGNADGVNDFIYIVDDQLIM